MTVEQLKDSGWIIYSVRTGSHAYGTNFPDSDFDEKGIYIMPTEQILKGNYIPSISDEDNDITYYEVSKFIEFIQEGNPNIAELLNMPKDCELYVSDIWTKHFTKEVRGSFISKSFKEKFIGYAKSQLRKSYGLNKKMNWESNRVEKKTVLDFCYILQEKEESVNFVKWCDLNFYGQDPMKVQVKIGLAKVNNFPDAYSMYWYEEGTYGILGEKSQQVRLANLPKGLDRIGLLRYDQNAYSTHCKDYNSYQEWLKNRNELRHVHNKEHGQDYDGKNLLHTVRLLAMAREIAEGKGVIVRRPDFEYLKSIRLGQVDLKVLHAECKEAIERVQESFESSSIIDAVDSSMVENLLFELRINNLNK